MTALLAQRLVDHIDKFVTLSVLLWRLYRICYFSDSLQNFVISLQYF